MKRRVPPPPPTRRSARLAGKRAVDDSGAAADSHKRRRATAKRAPASTTTPWLKCPAASAAVTPEPCDAAAPATTAPVDDSAAHAAGTRPASPAEIDSLPSLCLSWGGASSSCSSAAAAFAAAAEAGVRAGEPFWTDALEVSSCLDTAACFWGQPGAGKSEGGEGGELAPFAELYAPLLALPDDASVAAAAERTPEEWEARCDLVDAMLNFIQ